MLSAFKIVEICEKYDISVEQFFLVHLLYRKDYRSIDVYMTKCKGNHYSHDEIKLLVQRNIIQKEPIESALKIGANLELFDLFLTDEFAELYYIDSDEAGKELWENYPNTAYINGQDIILKKGERIGNIYYDKDALIKLYCSKIQNNKEVHNEIISKLKVNREKLNFTIRSFIFDELWESLENTSTDKQYNNTLII